jgi:hypothetical protein
MYQHDTTIPSTFYSNKDFEYLTELITDFLNEEGVPDPTSFSFSIEVTYLTEDDNA